MVVVVVCSQTLLLESLEEVKDKKAVIFLGCFEDE